MSSFQFVRAVYQDSHMQIQFEHGLFPTSTEVNNGTQNTRLYIVYVQFICTLNSSPGHSNFPRESKDLKLTFLT